MFKHPSAKFFVLPATFICLTLTTVARADDFPSYQHDNQRTGRTASNLDPLSLSQTWTASGFHSPLIVGNSLIARSSTQIDSFNIANGQVNWSVPGTVAPIGYGGGFVAQSFGVVVNSNVNTYLRLFNANTGATLYDVDIPEGPMPLITIAPDTTTSQYVAYTADGRGTLSATRLGSSSGTVLWTATGLLAGGGPSTIFNNYILLANIDHYYAIDRTSGAVIPFGSFQLSGGGGYVPVADESRNQFYINTGNTLRAFHLVAGVLTQLWQKTGAGIGLGAAAIGPDGKLYSNDNSTLISIDPITGNTVASVNGIFSTNATPILTDTAIWDIGPGLGSNLNPTLFVYNIQSLAFITKYTEQVAVTASTFNGANALDSTHFAFDGVSSNIFVSTGQALPEPTSLSILAIGSIALLKRRRNE